MAEAGDSGIPGLETSPFDPKFESMQARSEYMNRLFETRMKDPRFQRRVDILRQLFQEDPETAIKQAALNEELAAFDKLTGLDSKMQFEIQMSIRFSRIKRREAKGEESKPFALLFVDANNLKFVNDNVQLGGHQKGDEYLRAVGEVLAGVREVDTAARIGGDEFAVILDDTTEDGARLAIQRFKENFEKIKNERGLPEATGLSIGTAQWKPGMDYLELVRLADENMYEDKRRSKAQDINDQ